MDKFQKKLDALFKEYEGVRKSAEAEEREMTAEEIERRSELKTKIEDVKKRQADFLEEQEMRGDLYGDVQKPETRSGQPTITMEDQPIYRGSPSTALGQQLIDVALVTPGWNADARHGSRRDAERRLEQNTKRAMALIAKEQGQPVSKEFEQRSMEAIHNPEKRTAGTGQIQGIGSEGGFLLQSETSMDMMTHGFNNNVILPKVQKRTLTGSESLEIIGIDETSRADGSRGGGVRVYTDAELSQITSSMTKFQKIKLAPERLTGLYYASDKILMNATFLGQEMRQLFAEEFAFKTQDLVMEGTGAGQAQGIKNADCTISVDAEAGQLAGTIVTENVLNMFQRFYLRGGDGSVCWLANRNIFTQLMKMTYDVGTGGEMAKLYTPPKRPGETGSMLGYPLFFIEQAESLGTEGDLGLYDLSQYVCVDYGNINEASSIHFKFDYAQTTFRFIYYFDGQPRMVSPITPFKGSSSTVSPFVNIATRS